MDDDDDEEDDDGEEDDDDDDEGSYSYDGSRRRRSGRRGRRTPGNFRTTDDDGNKNSFTHISPAETVDEVVVRNAATRTPFATVKTTTSSFGTVSSTKKRERTMSGNARTDERRVTKYQAISTTWHRRTGRYRASVLRRWHENIDREKAIANS